MEERLRKVLARHKKRHLYRPERVRSAVLVPLFWQEDGCHILFIRRAQEVQHHKGQMAFPGGVFQPRDVTALNTALRESAEEIGLLSKDAEILGELDDVITTTSNFVISPFVARIPWPYCFLIDHGETEEIITAPLALGDQANLRLEDEMVGGEKVRTLTYHYRGNVIWGATARILTQLLEVMGRAETQENRLP
ncbi:MAG: CoA pyrophosphatase [Dehalococcoidia bacterium]|nr:MAG: CoA pyrophosphatase [Dehalococcoidia bacterium]